MWHAVTAEGRTLTRVPEHGASRPWAAGPLLPTVGRSVWTVRVDSVSDHAVSDDIMLGVCDSETSLHAWGVSLRSGKLVRTTRTPTGQYSNDTSLPGWPDGPRGWQVMPRGLAPREMLGARIDVLVDHEAGTLGFRVNGSQLHPALGGFPERGGAGLRPWAFLTRSGHRVSFEPGYLLQG